MSKLSRREFIYMMAMLGAAPVFANSHDKMVDIKDNLEDYYKLKSFGNVRLLHMTDSHAQLLPVYFREPSVNLGFDSNYGKVPHIVGEKYAEYFGIKGDKRLEYAMSCINFPKYARAFGRTGGYAQIKTVADFLRDNFGRDKTLFVDGGDTWQGSWTSLQTRGKDMVGAQNKLGIDILVGHWEFTYQQKEVLENVKALNAEFIAQNIYVTEDAQMNGAAMYNEDTGRAFKPYTIKKLGNARVAVIGQAFPYTTIANPARFIPEWSFGIHQGDMQTLVDTIRAKEKPDAVIVLSHNGFDVDKKLAEVTNGIDFILGGHTHDAVPEAIPVKNNKGQLTHVCNAGSNGKFISVLDLDVQKGKIKDFKFTLVPILSDLIEEDKDMKKYIEDVRSPFRHTLERTVATTDHLLFRRGNFNGSFDQIICDALREVNDAQVSLSPGFRWGTTVLPGDKITFDDLATQTAMTYPETYTKEITGKGIKDILEDVADNLFNKDPFYQQGGDMVRTGGISYKINPVKTIGHRITDLHLSNGERLEPNKKYKLSGWATVKSKSPGKPIWEITETYLQNIKHIGKDLKVYTPDIIGVKGNPGITSCSYNS
jgi:S-sulfosulfanyl-L-cysteine sulfohydrolase